MLALRIILIDRAGSSTRPSSRVTDHEVVIQRHGSFPFSFPLLLLLLLLSSGWGFLARITRISSLFSDGEQWGSGAGNPQALLDLGYQLTLQA